MGIIGYVSGQRAYMAHIAGNRKSDAKQPEEAKALHEKAVRLYQAGYEHHMDSPKMLMAYGVLLLRMGDYEKARDIMRATDKLPKMSKRDKQMLRINYAICQWKLGQLDNAISLLQEVSRDLTNSTIYGSLGFMLIERGDRTGDYEEARAYNLSAMEYDDDDPVILDNMGQLYYRLGEREKAYEHFGKALDKRPSQVDTLYYLAMMRSQDGDLDKAREHIQNAVRGNFSALATVSRDKVEALARELA